MDTNHVNPAPLPASAETPEEKRVRLVREAVSIAEADASIAVGRYASSAKVKAWIDSLGTDHELPVPYRGR